MSLSFPPMVFHRWISTGEIEDPEDQCISCGVIVPDDHGPLPISCPGSDVPTAHHFVMVGLGHLECARCEITIDGNTMPESVDWACADDTEGDHAR